MNLGKGLICMLKAVLLILFLVGVFLFLYDRGYLVLNSKSAVSYIGSQRGNAARFTFCSGSVKRVVRFREDGVSRFVLDVELSKRRSVGRASGFRQTNGHAPGLCKPQRFRSTGEKEEIHSCRQIQVCHRQICPASGAG